MAVLSFTRAVQRLFEQTWELAPLSVRNTVNGLLWVGGLIVYLGLTGLIHGRARPGQARARGGDRRHAAGGGVPDLDAAGC